MTLTHIDNSFYELTTRQAKKLTVDNQLPRHGYQKLVNLEELKKFENFAGTKHIRQAWVQHTIVTRLTGERECVLAVMVCWGRD